MTKQLILVLWTLLFNFSVCAQLFINEVVSFNDNTIADNYGEYDDWIEIYNSSNSSINLANYYISDDTLSPLKFKFPSTNSSLTSVPANGYLILWADNDTDQGEHHLNFKLNSGGESIVLTAADGITQIDLLNYGSTTIDQSYGRKPDGATSTFVFSSSTPASSNNNSAQKATPVIISPLGGIKSGTQTITLTTTLPGSSIYYTTNGNVPTSSSNYYSGPFTVSTNKSIRAVAIKSGYENSYPTTESYVFNYSTDLPVIFITIPPNDFSSNNNGFYVVGTNGVQGNCTSYDANFNQEWEKEVNITMYETDGSQVINQTAGAQISGGCSRKNPVRSFNIASKDIYGYSHFKHQLFPEYEQDKFKRFKLRNSGNNASSAYIRDVVGQKIIEGQVDIDQQRSRPVATFINGEYWGYYYMRDWLSEHYIDETHKIASKDSVDLIRGTNSSAWPQYAGTNDHYEDMWNYLDAQSSISNSEYQYIKDVYIDIDEYINYNIFQIFVANTDWPGNNQRQWREQNGGVFRYILYDTDFGYARNTNSSSNTYSGWNRNSMNFVTNNSGNNWPNGWQSTLVFRRLLTNGSFEDEFIQSFGTMLSIVFPYSRTSTVLNSEIAKVANERPEFYARWDGVQHPDGWTWTVNPSKTQTNYDKIDDFLENRPGHLYSHLVNFFNLNGTYNLTIPLSSNDHGRVVLNSNGYLAPYNYTGKYFDGVPITLKAIPKPGYRFSHWLETNQTTATIKPTFSSNVTRTPVFVPALDVVINEVHYHPLDSINEKEFIEIYNPDTKARDLTGYELSSGLCFAFPDGTTIQPNEYIIIAKDASQFTGNGYTVFQWTDSKLSNNGENLILQDQIGQTLDSIDYSDNFPWPLLSDGFGRSLELDYPVPALNEDPTNWHASAAIDGSPGAQNSMPCTATPPGIVINEINYNSNDQNNPGDWIELYNNTNSNVNLSTWKLYDSENAYAIPSTTVLPKNEYLIIAQDVPLFNGIFPHLQAGAEVIGGFDFSLSNGGERIGLFNNSECPVDELRYNDKTPWDSIPDGNGPTLSLTTPASDNSLPASWEGSNNINAPLGTPGRANVPCPTFQITVPATICKGEQVLLHTTSNNNATFNWVIQGGNPSSATGDSVYVTFPNPGLAFVTLNYTYFECSDDFQSLLTIQTCNSAPNPQPDNYTTNEDTPFSDNVLDNDSDPEGQPMTVSIITGVSNGTLSLNANGNFTYTPSSNYYGSDGFIYKVCDNAFPALCAVETVSITINSVNDVPTTTSDSYYGLEDSQLTGNVLNNDSDIENHTLTATVNTNPSNGTISLNPNGNFTYTPSNNFFGNDNFVYQVCDNGSPSLCATETVSFSLSPVNDAPVSVEDTYLVNEDNTLANNVLSNDSDIENNTLSASLITNVSNGSLSLNANGSFSYVPGSNYNGSDGFSYEVCDNGVPALCVTETVSITVSPVNDAPVSVADTYSLNEDNTLTENVLSNDSDIENHILSASVITNVSSGSLSLNTNGSFSYTPGSNYNGSDGFSYEVCDNGSPVLCVTETVSITVSPVNDAPVSVVDTYSVNEDNSLTNNVLSNDSDIENQPLTASLVTNVSNGSLILYNTGNFTYIPSSNYNGSDGFTYEVCDNGVPALCVTETVNLTVNAVNDAPNTLSDFYLGSEDVLLTGNVLTNDSDIDGNILTVTVSTSPNDGVLVLNSNGSFTYTPSTNYFGSDAFVYEVCDDGSPSLCQTENVNISISPVNDPPITNPDALTLAEDSPGGGGNVLTNDSEIENQPISVSLASNVSNGSLTFNVNGSYTYIPIANFNGTDQFTYQACDNASPALCVTDTVTITVTPVNDAPVTITDQYSTNEDIQLTDNVLTNDSDVDGNTLTASVSTNVSNGTLILQSDGSFLYTPNPNYFGNDGFEYQVCDNGSPSICLTETVSISILTVNDAPVPQPDSYTLNEDESVAGNVVTNDSDVENDPLTTAVISSVTNGTLTLNSNGTFIYVPNPNYFGSDGFSYEVCDNAPSCITETVTLTIASVNDTPIAINDSLFTDQDVQVAGDVSINDSDIETAQMDYSLVNYTQYGSVLFNFDGSFYYTPFAGYDGIDSFVYQACDTDIPLLCDTATVYIDVIPDCIVLDISLFLEGAFDTLTSTMKTTLNTVRTILPGMSANPVAGQPYAVAPWNYLGNEGLGWTDADYDSTVVDWVLISFRTDVTAASELFQIAGILHADGTMEFPETCIHVSELSGSFYIVVEHRNHMAAMTPVKVSVVNRTLSWDFRAANSYAVGGNGSKELGAGVWGLYAGDSNQVDDVVSYDINGKDKSSWLLDNGKFGVYLSSDINMNGDVNGLDKAVWLINNGVFGSVNK